MTIDRRKFLKSTAGITLGASFASKSVEATQSGRKRSVRVEQGKFLKKHAAQRQSIYNQLVPIFDPPDNADYADKFAESLVPSASSLLPGIAGSAADLKETLEWYNDILDSNGFRTVSQRGILRLGEDPRGRFGDGMDRAKEELIELRKAAKDVEMNASQYEQSPTQDNATSLIESLRQERDFANNTNWINGWSEISPDLYYSLFGGDSVEAAERVRKNADATSQIVAAAGDVAQMQAETLESGGLFRVPDLILAYSDQVDQVRKKVPGTVFSLYAGDSINIRIQNNTGEDVSVTWINTDDNGEISEYALLERSANADLMIPEETVEKIRSAENPSTEIRSAWNNNKISLEGHGFINSMKYNYTDKISGIFDALSGI